MLNIGLPDVPNVDAAIQGGGGQQEMLQRAPGYIRHRPSHINLSFQPHLGIFKLKYKYSFYPILNIPVWG